VIIFAVIVLAIAAIGAVAYPIVRPRQTTQPSDERAFEGIASRDEVAYPALEEPRLDLRHSRLPLPSQQAPENKDRERPVPKESGVSENAGNQKSKVAQKATTARQANKKVAAGSACSRCGCEIAKDARFCPECGQTLSPRCSRCGASYETGDRFCTRCGHSLSAREGK